MQNWLIGDSHFALLMEGPMSIDSVNGLATKILARGLRATNEPPDADPLGFHIAIGYLADPTRLTSEQAQAFLDRMMQVVREMKDGWRKAIRLAGAPLQAPKTKRTHQHSGYSARCGARCIHRTGHLVARAGGAKAQRRPQQKSTRPRSSMPMAFPFC